MRKDTAENIYKPQSPSHLSKANLCNKVSSKNHSGKDRSNSHHHGGGTHKRKNRTHYGQFYKRKDVVGGCSSVEDYQALL